MGFAPGMCSCPAPDATPIRLPTCSPRTPGRAATRVLDLERVLDLGVGPVRLGEDGELIIPPLPAEDIPAEAEVLKAELTELLPFAPIVSLLIELDRRTGFLECFTHAGGKQARTPELKRNLLAVLIANATNPRPDPHGRGVRHLLRRPGLDRRVVPTGRDTARGEPDDCELSPPTAA